MGRPIPPGSPTMSERGEPGAERGMPSTKSETPRHFSRNRPELRKGSR